jgi:hypothetical protein
MVSLSKTDSNILLVLFADFVKATPTMKRLLTLVVLLGLLGVFAGCNPSDSGTKAPDTGTNAPAAPAAPGTNAAK